MKKRNPGISAPEAADTPEFDYNAIVKRRLIAWRDAFEQQNCGAKLNYSEIAHAMETDFKIRTSPQKIGAMFDSQSPREVKLQEVAALCQIFHIPMQEICAYPNAPASDMDLSGLVSRRNARHTAVKQLDSPFYEGTYYCYYFRPKHYQDRLNPVAQSDIEEAMLDIRILDGQTTLTLREMRTNRNFYGDGTLPCFTLSGKLYHFENTDMAYSFIADPTGQRAMALMFTYLNLSADIRYYITAAMMTFSANQTHVPLFQKMAMFRVKQDIRNDPDAADVVRGILALNSCPVMLDEETLARLRAEDPDMARLLAADKALKKCYAFSEAAIRSDAFFIHDENVKTGKLLKLRRSSLYPAHEIVAEPDHFSDFIKQYQQRQMPGRQAPEDE